MSATAVDTPPANVFWGEITPGDHIAHFYDHEENLLVTLAGFIAEGLEKGEAAIVIATPKHLAALEDRLANRGLDLAKALIEDRYIALDPKASLASFMRNGWPDDRLFEELVDKLIKRASRKGRRVRAFGEMVALMWANGQKEATIRLEHLWNKFCRSYGFCLLCSYPRAGFMKDQQSMEEICGHHSRALGNNWKLREPAGWIAA